MSEGPSVTPRIRPGWVWGISLFYVVFSIWALLARVLIWLNLYPVSEKQLAILRNESVGSGIFGLVLAGVSLAAAIMLWLLRRQAFPLFVAACVLAACNSLWKLFLGGALGHLMSQSTLTFAITVFGVLAGWAISIAICVYVWTLRRRGVLQ